MKSRSDQPRRDALDAGEGANAGKPTSGPLTPEAHLSCVKTGAVTASSAPEFLQKAARGTKKLEKLPRRDRCYLVGLRAAKLTEEQAALAWGILARHLQETLGEMDVPKFNQLLEGIRGSTVVAKRLLNAEAQRREDAEKRCPEDCLYPNNGRCVFQCQREVQS